MVTVKEPPGFFKDHRVFISQKTKLRDSKVKATHERHKQAKLNQTISVKLGGKKKLAFSRSEPTACDIKNWEEAMRRSKKDAQFRVGLTWPAGLSLHLLTESGLTISGTHDDLSLSAS